MEASALLEEIGVGILANVRPSQVGRGTLQRLS